MEEYITYNIISEVAQYYLKIDHTKLNMERQTH